MTSDSYSLFNPDPVLVLIGLTVSLLLGLYQLYGMGDEAAKQANRRKRMLKADGAAGKLKTHCHAHFGEKKFVRVADKVYIAVGYGASNCIFIEGTEAFVAIDAAESAAVATEVLRAFRSMTSKPIQTIILTHADTDHVGGLNVFASSFRNIDIVAHQDFGQSHHFLYRSAELLRRRLISNGSLTSNQDVSCGTGIGNRISPLKLSGDLDLSNFSRVKRFNDQYQIRLAGLELEVFHAPGYSDDHVMVWWREKKFLFPGKNVFSAFPDQYSVNGGPSRDCLKLVKVVDRMIRLRPVVLIPQCTRPLVNSGEISDCLSVFRDIVKFLHDQTVRYMNKGLCPDEIIDAISVPPYLDDHPFVQEFHGNHESFVRGVFHHYIGWFSGDAVDLHPLTRKQEALEIVDLAGNAEKMVSEAKYHLEGNAFALALQICQWLLLANKETPHVQELQAKALDGLAARESSSISRNWYLSMANQENFMKSSITLMREEMTASPTLRLTLRYLFCKVDPSLNHEMSIQMKVVITDCSEVVILKFENGILHIFEDHVTQRGHSNLDIVCKLPVWTKSLLEKKYLLKCVKDKKILISPKTDKFVSLMTSVHLW